MESRYSPHQKAASHADTKIEPRAPRPFEGVAQPPHIAHAAIACSGRRTSSFRCAARSPRSLSRPSGQRPVPRLRKTVPPACSAISYSSASGFWPRRARCRGDSLCRMAPTQYRCRVPIRAARCSGCPGRSARCCGPSGFYGRPRRLCACRAPPRPGRCHSRSSCRRYPRGCLISFAIFAYCQIWRPFKPPTCSIRPAIRRRIRSRHTRPLKASRA